MKPLTIEELKALNVGDWVWIIDMYGKEKESAYTKIIGTDLDGFTLPTDSMNWEYEDYGSKWTAYKNKEHAESSIPDVNKKCCNNCRCKGFGENKGEKLNKLFAENGVQYEDGVYSSYIDRRTKRHDIMQENCCDDFDNRWIQYPLGVAAIETADLRYNKGLGHPAGKLVRVRPCGKEYEGKTYLGFYLGDLPLNISYSYNRETHILNIYPHNNPAIFVPQIGKIVFGCESWWGEIESPDDLKDITDECINNQWYVKALKELDKKD